MQWTAVQVVVQVVSWPLAVLVARSWLRRRTGWVAAPVIILLAANAVLHGLDPTGQSSGARLAAVVVNIAIAVVLAVYPTGRPEPQWVAAVVALVALAQLANVISGLTLEEQPWWPWQFLVLWPPLLWGQLRRYRSRSDPLERQQVRWVLATMLTMVAGFLIMWFGSLDGLVTPEASGATAPLLLLLPGAGVAIGLLAPGRARMDAVMRAVLAVGLTALAVALGAFVASALAANLTEPQRRWIAIAVAGVVAGLTWGPARRAADRVVYGRRGGPLTALDDLDELLAAHHDATMVPVTVVRTLAATLGAEHVAMRDGSQTVATVGDPGRAAEEFEVTYRGVRLATVAVAPRRGEQSLTPADRAVVRRVCAYAGPALDGARALAELVDARARVVLAREEERKRMRAYLHDDLAPTFSGLALSAAALENFAATDRVRATNLAQRLAGETAAAARRLRDVAYDLRPPSLDNRGLVAALTDEVGTRGGPPTVQIVADVADADLPAAVETAAYRIVQEAVANVRRHAAASTCTVVLRSRPDRLEIEVSDDGVGFAEPPTPGVGLTSMRERATELGGVLTVGAGACGGTLVRGRLPLTRDRSG